MATVYLDQMSVYKKRKYSISAVTDTPGLGSATTHCNAVMAMVTSAPTKGVTMVAPMRPSWKKVLYLLMVVGRTSAEGREKSQ